MSHNSSHNSVRWLGSFRGLAVCVLIAVKSLALAGAALAQSPAPKPGETPKSGGHPLDPLTSEEMAVVVDALKAQGKLQPTSRFPIIVLNEPPKELVLGFKPGSEAPREAFANVYERASNRAFEAIVDLRKKSLVSWKELTGVQPSRLYEEFMFDADIVRANPEWQAAVRKRGVTDFQNVAIDLWGGGYYGFPDEQGFRVGRAFAYYKGKTTNYYARPIEGVVAFVNLNTMKVFKVIDAGVAPVPKGAADFDPASIGPTRPALRPLVSVQPEGASFTVKGQEVRWDGWSFHFGMHPREGLVLYTVSHADKGKPRSVLYRAAVSEMVVPYGDPGPAWFIRNAFDEGEDSMGRFASSLEPRADCPENTIFFDAVFPDDNGVGQVRPRAVGLFERDGGLLWRHNWGARVDARRARQLVLMSVVTVGNYDYAFEWIFHQDGTLQLDILLTGIMQTKAVAREKETQAHGQTHGHLVAPNLEAVHHQHFFNFRLDLDIDRPSGNSVVEMNAEPMPEGPGNPQRNGMVMHESLLRTESEGQRNMSIGASRKWKIINPSVTNSLGHPAGYVLAPGENSVPLSSPDSWVRKRAGFINSHLWVTPYEPAELYAGGTYINHNQGGDGLPKWTAANRSINQKDVVLWYTLGVTHIPRPEEWPVMPAHRVGFKLVPSGRFDRNPALDVPVLEAEKRP